MAGERNAASPPPSPPATPATGGLGPRPEGAGGRAPRKRRGRLRLAAWALGIAALLCLAAFAGALAALRNETVQAWLTEKINASLNNGANASEDGLPAGVRARITHLSGPLPFAADLGLELYDGKGLWLRLPSCSLKWDWRALPAALRIAAVRIDKAQLLRLPELPASPPPPPSPPLSEAALRDLLGEALRTLGSLPAWLPDVRLDRLAVDAARLPGDLLGASDATDGENPSVARLDASLTLFAGTAGAKADAAVRLSGDGGAALRLAGASFSDAEATVKASLVPVRTASKALGANAVVQLSAALNVPLKVAAPVAAGAASGPAAREATRDVTGAAMFLEQGAHLDLRLEGRATAPEAGGAASDIRVALQDVAADVGKLHVTGRAVWSGDATGSWFAGPLDTDLQVLLGTVAQPEGIPADAAAKNAPAAGLGGMLPEAARLCVTATGPLEAPDVRVAVDCPAWTVAGHAIADAVVRLESEPFRWRAVLHPGARTPSSAGEDVPKSTELAARLRVNALLDQRPLSLAATFFAAPGDGAAPSLLRAGLRDFQCDLLGVNGSGHVDALVPTSLAAGPPRADGRVDVRVTDWRGIASLLPGARMQGEASLSLELQSRRGERAAAQPVADMQSAQAGKSGAVSRPIPESGPRSGPEPAPASVEKSDKKTTPEPSGWAQRAVLRWNVPRFSYAAGNAPAVEVRSLDGEATLDDAFGKGLLTARLRLAAARRGDVSLGASVRVDGSVFGGLDVGLETTGFAATRCNLRWQPGQVDLRRLDVALPAQKLGLHAAGASVRYGDVLAVENLNVSVLPSGRLRARAVLGADKLDAQVDLEHFSLAPWRVLVPGLPSGSVEARVRLSGSPAQPGGDLRVRARGLALPNAGLKPMDVTLTGRLEREGAQTGALAVRLAPDPATVKALGGTECRVEARVPLLFDKSGLPQPNMQGPLRASVRWNGAVAPLWSLLPVADQRLAGRLALSLDVGGTPAAPKPKGFVRMDGGRYENLLLGLLLTDITTRLDLAEGPGGAPGLARLRFSAADGLGGTARIIGQAGLDGGHLDFNAVADHLRPLRRRDVRVDVSAQTSVTGSASAPEVRGLVTVNQGLVLLNNLNMTASITTLPISEAPPAWVRTSGPAPEASAKAADHPDHRAENGAAARSSAKSVAKPAGQAGASGTGLLDLRIVIPGRFMVEGFGLKSEWQANLHVGGTPAEPVISGQLNAVKGSLDILGKNFKLARGAVTFGGGSVSNPLLDIVLTSQTPALTANITLTGTARKMRLVLSSDPEMPRDEILAQILFGKSTSELGRLENLRLAAAVAQLAGFGSGNGGGGVLDSARQALGVDVLRFNSSSSGSAQAGQSGDMAAGSSVEMGKYLTEDIYVGVQQGTKQGSTAFVIQLELTPRANLELRTEQQNTTGGLTWKYNY